MILVIDNYDSFTFNLVQLIAGAGRRAEVIRNDAEGVDDLLARRPAGIVISPGPGRPEDAGVSVELLARRARIPILGVCLGHQAMGTAFGARVILAERLMHGKVSEVTHDGVGIFRRLPNPFIATRYHSLVVEEDSLPDELQAVAWSGNRRVLQGMRHRELPYWGVQFHPESILTDRGGDLMDEFLALCDAAGRDG